jgi:methionyl-tRNA formyltransferase
MKIIYLGATKFSFDILEHLYKSNIKIDALFTIPQEFNISYSDKKVKNYNFFDMKDYAQERNIPVYKVDSVAGEKLTDYKDVIQMIEPDVILVMGWYYMVPKSIRKLAKYGAWGIHASLLPKYAGGAPLVWAIIEGEKEAGVSLFMLDNGVDDGDIIAQEAFPIEYEDSIKEVYEKATIASKKILVEAITNIKNITPKVQDKSAIQVYPQRSPKDGEIDLKQPADVIYNFIRAQAPPYPGAFIKTSDNKKLIIEKARVESIDE